MLNERIILVKDFDSIESHVKWIIDNRFKKHDGRKYPAKLIYFDFQHSRFLKPYHIAPLACLIQEYIDKGFKIKFRHTSENIKKFFVSFGFEEACKKGDLHKCFIPTDKRTFPLWHIKENEQAFYIETVKKYYENNQFKNSDLFALSNSLAELMNNVFDHSASRISGYTFTHYNGSNNQLITCVCDFGIGIPRSVNEYLVKNNKEKLDTIEALKLAFNLTFSSKTKPHNRGFGWNNIFDSLRNLEGKLIVVSNNVLYYLINDSNKEVICQMSCNFPGTLVVIYLDKNKIPIKEEEILDELVLLE